MSDYQYRRLACLPNVAASTAQYHNFSPKPPIGLRNTLKNQTYPTDCSSPYHLLGEKFEHLERVSKHARQVVANRGSIPLVILFPG